jgi:FkbH-like protein
MLLKPEQFAALRINWNDKATSIREIAAELNIGLDAIAFLDDNPVEREWVRRQLPMVTVIELPPDPLLFAQTLRGTPMFERLSLSAEDRERGRYYAEQRSRTTLAEQAGSLEDFYRSLAMEIEIEHVTEATQLRVAQLTQKTNQFNLTTRRRSEQEIAALAAGREATVYTARVRDRFGDNGLVGVAIVHCRGDECEIDTLLLSCRVMGRTVETAFLATIAEEARDAGHRTLSGWYRPTAKNAVVEDLYRSHGFIAAEETATGVRWSLDLTTADLRTPPWIVRHLKLAHFV